LHKSKLLKELSLHKEIRIFTLLSLLISIFSYGQEINYKDLVKKEDSLKIYADIIMNGSSEKEKKEANSKLKIMLERTLKTKTSFEYPFDKLITIAKIQPSDKKFRIFNWLLKKDNGEYEYYAIIQHQNKKEKNCNIITLVDNSKNIRNPEQEELNEKNWYGSLYYDIITIKKEKQTLYTTLSWDGNDGYSTKKIIDVMYFKNNKELKFGLPIFKNEENKTQKRIIIEYDSRTSISVKKDDKKIIFNNLIPPRKDLKGLHAYYIPDGSFNSYIYKKGKWWLEKDIDARNKNKTKKFKAPRRGITPR
jgi:hypothetical protein